MAGGREVGAGAGGGEDAACGNGRGFVHGRGLPQGRGLAAAGRGLEGPRLNELHQGGAWWRGWGPLEGFEGVGRRVRIGLERKGGF